MSTGRSPYSKVALTEPSHAIDIARLFSAAGTLFGSRSKVLERLVLLTR